MRQFRIWIGITALAWALNAPAAVTSTLNQAQEAKPVPMASTPLSSVGGQKTTLADFKGNVLLIDFWASWCGPCRQSFPWMNGMQQQYRAEGLEVVAINLDEEPELAREFLRQVPAQFTVLLDSDAQLPDAFGLIGMPSSYLIDRQGRLRAQHIGFHANRVAEYENSIKALLAE